MSNPLMRCPRCRRELLYDSVMDAWLCPEADCGLVLRVAPGAGGTGWHSTGEEDEYDWGERRPRYGWRLFAGIVVLITIVALVAMMLSPLLWPQRASLHVSPTYLLFVDDTGTGTMPQALAVRNQGRGVLEWEVRNDSSWLSVEPTSGTLESDLQILTVRADITALPEGMHQVAFSIVAQGAHNSPQTVQVQVQRAAPSWSGTIRDFVGEEVDIFYDVQPPYVANPLGVTIELVNNDDAVDVTWDELVEFLIDDPTDESPYIRDFHMCGAFAQQLHNNAEDAGIRASWVSIDLRGREIGHALNAFHTLDRGLVFIDCTGEDATAVAAGLDAGMCDHDKVAYVKIGREYGLISLDYAASPRYEFYEEYNHSWDEYIAALDEFNVRVQEYNEFVRDRSLVSDSEDARRAQRLYNELETMRVTLEMQRELLGPCRWNTLGVVDRVRIYW